MITDPGLFLGVASIRSADRFPFDEPRAGRGSDGHRIALGRFIVVDCTIRFYDFFSRKH